MRINIIRISLILFCLFPCFSDAQKSNDFVLCTWNIGHFSNGSKPYSLISNDYGQQLESYRSLIYDEICPDVIAINEYNIVFCGEDKEDNPYKTSSLLFDGFKKNTIGPKCWGICNAVFSNHKMRKSRPIYFESQNNTAGDDVVKSRENYFIESDLYIHGKKVKLVCLHLLFSSKVEEVFQQNQTEELVNRYINTKRVIVCGDWNTEVYSSLKNAGYTLANDGSLKTFPSKSEALDNIAVKGLEIAEVKMVKTDLSDHYPLVCRISLK